MGSELTRLRISDYFSGDEYSLFRKYCDKSNIIYLDSLKAVDYVAFQSKVNADKSFVRGIRNKVTSLLNSTGTTHENEQAGGDIEATEPTSVERQSNEHMNEAGPSQYSPVTGEATGIEKEAANPSTNRKNNHKKAKNSADQPPVFVTSDSSIKTLKLSVRTYNILMRAGINSVGKLKILEEADIFDIRGAGPKIASEIKKVQSLISIEGAQNPKDLDLIIDEYLSQNNLRFRSYVRELIVNCYTYPKPAKPSLTSKQQKIFDEVTKAQKNIGKRVCRAAYQNPDAAYLVQQGLQSFIEVTDLKNLFQKIPPSRLNNSLLPYLKIFLRSESQLPEKWKYISNQCLHVIDLGKNFDDFVEQGYTSDVEQLLRWLGSDILKQFIPSDEDLFHNERESFIIQSRAAGKTLQYISESLGVTRERIRQIEGNVLSRFRIHPGTHLILSIISAELNDKKILLKDKVKKFLNDNNLLLFLLTRSSGKRFSYEKHLDLFFEGNCIKPLWDAINNLPITINDSDYLNVIAELCALPNASVPLCRQLFENIYTLHGINWVRGRLSKTFMIGLVLEKYYPNGLHVYDKGEVYQLQQFCETEFGDLFSAITPRSLAGTMFRIGILHDRGTYIHPSLVNVNDDLLIEIEEFFLSSNRTSMAFHELFEEFKDELILEANITNRYALQGILKQKFGEKYYFYKNGISKEDNVKVDLEIENFVRKHSSIAKQDLLAEFAGITEAMLVQTISRLEDVLLWENATYIHSNILKIAEEDFDLREDIQHAVSEGPITASKLFEALYNHHYEFFERNNIFSADNLFAILEFMFNEEFNFSRPYISSLDIEVSSQKDLLLNYLNGQDRVLIEEIEYLCEEYHLGFKGPSQFIPVLRDDYLQIDENTLAAISSFQISKQILEEIHDFIEQALSLKGYRIFEKIDNYIFFPDVGYSWSHYQLRAFIQKFFSGSFTVITNRLIHKIGSDIIVNSSLGINNYDDFIKHLIRQEHKQQPFHDVTTLVQWLINEGLVPLKALITIKASGLFEQETHVVNESTMKYLLRDNFISFDNSGKLIIQGGW